MSWKAGHDNLKFPPSASLLRKYYSIANDLGYLKNAASTIPEATGKNAKEKKKSTKIKINKGKKKSKKKKKKKTSHTGIESLVNDMMNVAKNDIESSHLEPLAGSSQSGSGLDWKSLLDILH